MSEKWADAAREKDLNPDPQYAEANRLRTQIGYLLGALTTLAVALVFYTLFEVVTDRLKYLTIALGTVLLLTGVADTLFIELR